MWNLTKFVYYMFNNGKKIQFLNKYKSKDFGLKSSIGVERLKKMAIKHNKKMKGVFQKKKNNENLTREEIKELQELEMDG